MMATEDPPLSETLLRQAAEHSLRAFLEPNAIFLAERLHLMYPSEVSANLLATAHLREGNFSRAAEILHPATSSENRYLYAVCLSRIGTPEALREAEAHLRGLHGPIDVSTPTASGNAANTPGGAAGLYLLGTICHRTGRREEAVTLFQRAVQANPTLWVAFEALANMGIVAKAEQVLGNLPDSGVLERLETQPQFYTSPPATQQTPRRRNRSSGQAQRPVSAPTSRGHGYPLQNGIDTSSNTMQSMRSPMETADSHSNSYATPSPMPSSRVGQLSFADMMTPAAPQAPAGRNNFGGRRGMRSGGTPLNTTSRPTNRRNNPALDSHVRNPSDLFSTPTGNVQSFSSRESHGGVFSSQPSAHIMDPKAQVSGGVAAGAQSRTRTSSRPKSAPPEETGSPIGTDAMDLIRALGQIVAELGRFRCTRTLELTGALPKVHRRSGMVLSLRGRAFLEKGDYAAAEQEFLRSLQLEPTRMDGIVEYYSTVLWHLKKEKELAQLAIRAQRVYPISASAWCAAGNCFSLQRDPDAALRFFRKAIATSKVPNAYAYTLSGHEHAVKENFEAALSAFRQALHIDERHYNAMYGIGQVLQKQEKYVLAQSHFRSAVLIHPLNSTLHYHLGMALAAAAQASGGELMARGATSALISASAEFETAANLDPRNPVPRFEKAKMLVLMNKLPDARRQLELLRDSLPKEAEVHFELSQVCRRLGDVKSALQALSIALDIEPKERKYKKALEALSNQVESYTPM